MINSNYSNNFPPDTDSNYPSLLSPDPTPLQPIQPTQSTQPITTVSLPVSPLLPQIDSQTPYPQTQPLPSNVPVLYQTVPEVAPPIAQINPTNDLPKTTTLQSIVVIAALLIFNPLGLVLMHKISNWKKWLKILILLASFPLYVWMAITVYKLMWEAKTERVLLDVIKHLGSNHIFTIRDMRLACQ